MKMRYLAIIFAALMLTACSIQGMVEKTVPENVRADHTAHIDRLLAKDTSRIEQAFDLDMSDPDTQESVNGILANVSEGAEIRRDFVSMNSSSSVKSGQGKSRDISLTTEVQTEGGFMTVTGQYALGPDGECCVLTNISAEKFESSPIRASLEALKKGAKLAGLIILLFVLGLVAFLMIRKRRKAVG